MPRTSDVIIDNSSLDKEAKSLAERMLSKLGDVNSLDILLYWFMVMLSNPDQEVDRGVFNAAEILFRSTREFDKNFADMLALKDKTLAFITAKAAYSIEPTHDIAKETIQICAKIIIYQLNEMQNINYDLLEEFGKIKEVETIVREAIKKIKKVKNIDDYNQVYETLKFADLVQRAAPRNEDRDDLANNIVNEISKQLNDLPEAKFNKTFKFLQEFDGYYSNIIVTLYTLQKEQDNERLDEFLTILLNITSQLIPLEQEFLNYIEKTPANLRDFTNTFKKQHVFNKLVLPFSLKHMQDMCQHPNMQENASLQSKIASSEMQERHYKETHGFSAPRSATTNPQPARALPKAPAPAPRSATTNPQPARALPKAPAPAPRSATTNPQPARALPKAPAPAPQVAATIPQPVPSQAQTTSFWSRILSIILYPFTLIINFFRNLFSMQNSDNSVIIITSDNMQRLKALDSDLPGILNNFFKARENSILQQLTEARSVNNQSDIARITEDLNDLRKDWQQIMSNVNDPENFCKLVELYIVKSQTQQSHASGVTNNSTNRNVLTFSNPDPTRVDELQKCIEHIREGFRV